ncbi:hypothetical protein GIB67_035048 [Kingdonia uniflora]|uniref:Carboxypeptidase n=1 Tax=Kingdonia uniflora TaxID=39325 RepID=A0A7J7L1N5_9MAGN|nr:hypothetical protein GIB67_035048 [Kingdonia uniflora]
METTLNLFTFILFISLSLPYLLSATSTTLFPKEALPTKSGYLPISPNSNSSMFYTFYEAQQPTYSLAQTPLLFWLQGGPGCSSSLGNFFELGPWRVTPNHENPEIPILKPNPGAWNNLFGVVFPDNPIGTGFSIASTPEEIPKDQETVAKHFITALTAFIKLHPSFKSRPVYLTGESYAGKYVPAIGYYILQQNSRLPVSRRVNFGGVAIGNGLTHPVAQVVTHAVTAYYSGLINAKQRVELEEIQNETINLIKKGKWNEATDARITLLVLLQNMTGLATLYDYTRKIPYETDLVDKFLNIEEVQKALGVEKTIFREVCSTVVGTVLHDDVMKSVKFMVEELLKNTRVLLYQGQFDLRDGVITTEAWIKKLRWKGLKQFLMAERKVWQVNGKFAGYVQRWARLTEVVVSGAGHLVPADQAVNSQAMIQDWILERGLFTYKNCW